MKRLTLEQLETINGQSKISGACATLGAGSVVYGIGVSTQFWNPVGWVSAAFLVADAACVAYGIGSMM